ncbi:MAG: copper chaperone PCu(A)C [Gammaproteobacteria bacterium]|nr:MAG: copper chaperone PCu(A)C [Gammaproteobacteria bacterium]
MNKLASRLILILLLIPAGILNAGSTELAPLVVEDAWLREALPNAQVLVGYMSVENMSRKGMIINSLKSNDFAAIMIHDTNMQDGMTRMREKDNLKIEGRMRIELMPGGIHLMFMSPKRELKEGDKVEVEMRFDNGTNVPVTFVVKRGTAN